MLIVKYCNPVINGQGSFCAFREHFTEEQAKKAGR